MQLTLTVLRCPQSVTPETRTIAGGEFTVGRGPGVDWVLADPDHVVSKRHFAVAFRAGGWQIADHGTNGTFVNHEEAPIGQGNVRNLRDHDRLRVGAYEIEIHLEEEDARPRDSNGYGGGAPMSSNAFDDPLGSGFPDSGGHSSFGAAPARNAFDDPWPQGGAGGSDASLIPNDFDPLAAVGPGQGFGAPFRGPTQSDHSSPLDDAFQPPMQVGQAPLSGGVIPADDLLSDDWDKDLLEGIVSPAGSPPPAAPPPAARQAPPPPATPAVSPYDEPVAPRAAPPPASPRQPIPSLDEPAHTATPFDEPLAPASRAAPPPAAAAPQAIPPFDEPLAPALHPAPQRPAAPPQAASPFDEPAAPAPRAVPPQAASPFNEPPPTRMPAPRVAPPPAADVSPFDEPDLPASPPPAQPRAIPPRPTVAPPVTPPPQPAQPAAASAPGDTALLAAFFEGVNLSDARPADPITTMRRLGEAFRAVVAGLRAVLIARASIKSEFRIEQTLIRSRGNNPLKFSADDDDAVSALLGVGRRTDMTPAAAVTDALRDIRLHELASMAAMQSAVRSVLDGISPDNLRTEADRAGGMTVLPVQRKARAWDFFEARHARTVQALSDDFDSVFGKAFARAYEEALEDLTAKERQ